MSKRKIIIWGVIGLFIVLNIVMFGFVFRLKNQTVVVVGENLLHTEQEIINAAKLENGKSIFLLDKDKATQNIENEYADVKVIQIKTTGLRSIEIKVRARHKTYFVKFDSAYFVLDEDLKVLTIHEGSEIPAEWNLVEIESSLVNLSSTVKKCDFVGSQQQKEMFYNLYVSVHTNTTISEKEPTHTDSHANMGNIIKSVSYSVEGAKDGGKDNILLVKTENGVEFKIHQADKNLNQKFNFCYKLMNGLVNNFEVIDKTSGVVELYDISADSKVQYQYMPAENK